MRFLFSFLILFLVGCGGPLFKKTIRVGVDPSWYPVDFNEQGAFVNGFVDDLLLTISEKEKIQFEKIVGSFDNLYQGLQEGRYDVVVGLLPRYEYYRGSFDFSEDFLQLGTVLVTRSDEKVKKWEDMDGKIVGSIEGDSSIFLLQPYPKVVPRPVFRSIPELLIAVKEGAIDGAMLSYIPAVQFVNDLFYGELKIAMEPLNPSGLKWIALKDSEYLRELNQAIHSLQKKGTLNALHEKWNLVPTSPSHHQ